MKKPKATKGCLNPSCGKTFTPGHYGDRQLVCSGSYTEKCLKRCPGKACKRCAGKGSYKATCTTWYRVYWSQTRKPPRGMSDEDREKVLKLAKREDLQYWSLLVAAGSSALRKGELLGITWGDIQDRKEIRSNFPLRGQWDDHVGFKETKTDTGRIAFFLAEVREALLALRAHLGKVVDADRIWPYTEVSTWSKWVMLQKRCKVTNPDTRRPYRFHDLRHTAALRALKRTGKLSDASTLCGHRNPATTAIYTQQRPEDFVASLEGGK